MIKRKKKFIYKNRDKESKYKYDDISIDRKKRSHSDGYHAARDLDLKANKDNITNMPSLIPLNSSPAPRADLDLYYKDTGQLYYNGGYTNILTRFKRVDSFSKNTRTVEQAVPDYINNYVDFTMPAYLNTEYSNYLSAAGNVPIETNQTLVNVPAGDDENNPQNTTNVAILWGGIGTSLQFAGNKFPQYVTYTATREYNRNTWFQWLYNKFANNTAFSSVQAMNPNVYSLNDTSPLNLIIKNGNYTMRPWFNTLMCQWDAVNMNMLYLVSRLRWYKITKVLLKRFADKHLELSNTLNECISAISSVRFIKLLDNISDELSTLPCDNNYIENYVKRIEPSLSGDSYYDPVLIPLPTYQMPQYQIQWEGGTPFTPWCQNFDWESETSSQMLTEDGYSFTYEGKEFNVGAGYPIYSDPTGNHPNMFYYNTNVTLGQQGWYDTGKLPPYCVRHMKVPGLNYNVSAQSVLQQIQKARDNAQTNNSNYVSFVGEFRDAWLSELQDILACVTNFKLMMAPFFSLYELIEQSGLARYHAKRWEWDITISRHYDGWQWDWIKHPEACIANINNVANTTVDTANTYLNAHNQYATGIAMKYTSYDGHIVDNNAMYSVCGGWYYSTNVADFAVKVNSANTMHLTPFTDVVSDNKVNGQVQTAFDNNYVSYNTFMLPKAILEPQVFVYNYYGDSTTFQITDADTTTLQGVAAYSPSTTGTNLVTGLINLPYPQAWICVNNSTNGQYKTTGWYFTMQYLLRFLGIIAQTGATYTPATKQNLQVSALYTDGYTSYLPITVYNDVNLYYDEAVREHPFTVVTKPNAQKVMQVAH